jgi:hypothetical protein
MDKLTLPEYSFRIRQYENNKAVIFDPIRKKDVLLTPEEWVRQNLIRFLIEERFFPSSLISIESSVKINKLNRRFDALVYSRIGHTLLLIECKAPNVEIRQETFDQIIAYNHKLNAPYMLVSNGLKHYFCKINLLEKKYIFLDDIPKYEEL